MSTATQTDQVVADLQAITSFLGTMKGTGNYDSVREGQVLAIIQRVQGMKLKPQDGTAFGECLAARPLERDTEPEVL